MELQWWPHPQNDRLTHSSFAHVDSWWDDEVLCAHCKRHISKPNYLPCKISCSNQHWEMYKDTKKYLRKRILARSVHSHLERSHICRTRLNLHGKTVTKSPCLQNTHQEYLLIICTTTTTMQDNAGAETDQLTSQSDRYEFRPVKNLLAPWHASMSADIETRLRGDRKSKYIDNYWQSQIKPKFSSRPGASYLMTRK